MFLTSIRWRLQLWHGLLLVLVLAGFGFTAYQLQRSNQWKRIDQELQHRVSVLAGAMRRPPGEPPSRPPPEGGDPLNHRPDDPLRPPEDSFPPRLNGPGRERSVPPGLDLQPRDIRRPGALRLPAPDQTLFQGSSANAFYYLVWTRDGRLLSHSESAPAEVSRPPRGPRTGDIRARGNAREMVQYLPPGECILVGTDIGRELADLRQFAGILFGAGGAVLAFGLAGGWWLSTRAIRPIKDISATAMKISSGDLSQRIPAADTDNELGQLASVLNSTFARLEASFAQQARFTSDAAHELRTPVSVMLTQTQSILMRE